MWYSAFVKENVFMGIVSVNEAITIHDVVPVPKIHFLRSSFDISDPPVAS